MHNDLRRRVLYRPVHMSRGGGLSSVMGSCEGTKEVRPKFFWLIKQGVGGLCGMLACEATTGRCRGVKERDGVKCGVAEKRLIELRFALGIGFEEGVLGVNLAEAQQRAYDRRRDVAEQIAAVAIKIRESLAERGDGGSEDRNSGTGFCGCRTGLFLE